MARRRRKNKGCGCGSAILFPLTLLKYLFGYVEKESKGETLFTRPKPPKRRTRW